jgi:beta-lactamase regulating signal transducer with metallopeptidase domain
VEGLLANWMWQGCAVALAATVVLRSSGRMSATTRYHLWWITLAVVLLLPAASFQLPALSSQLPAPSFPHIASSAQSGDPSEQVVAGSRKREAGSVVVLPPLPAWTGALLLFVWSAWATTSLARTVAALVTLRRAKRSVRSFPAAREVRLHTWLSLRGRGRRARLAVSDHVRAAAVLGLTSPSIAVAPIALDALNDEELDQIVVHEWAHVYRRDDVVRLVQRVIVALAGLHPAVWWIDRQLHLERETACDDWAVNATGSARALAVSLTKLASLPGRPADALLLPAAFASSELTTRIVRLLDRRRNTSTARAFGAPMIVAPILGTLALTIASVELVVTSPIVSETAQLTLPTPTPTAVAESDAVSPSPQPAVPSASGRSPRKFRDVAPTTATTRARSAAPADSSEGAATPAASAADDDQPRVVVTGRPVDVGEWETENLPGTRAPVGDVLPTQAVRAITTAQQAPVNGPTLWGVAADAGVTVGKSSQKAAVATAGFFTRLSKSIAGVF